MRNAGSFAAVCSITEKQGAENVSPAFQANGAAHQDREDDALIGIKSAALLFGYWTRSMLAVFYALAVALIALAGWTAGAGKVFLLGVSIFAAMLSWQIARLDISDPALCLALFKSNRDAGLVLFAALVLDQLATIIA